MSPEGSNHRTHKGFAGPADFAQKPQTTRPADSEWRIGWYHSPALMIDVLAFPPDAVALDAMRAARITRAAEFQRRARVASFVSITLFLTWVADVAAVFERHHSGAVPATLGVASLVLAVIIVAAHIGARVLAERAENLRLSTERAFTAVRLHQAGELVELATHEPVVAQYLRMVGRQGRPLQCVELTALIRWGASAASNDPVIARSEARPA